MSSNDFDGPQFGPAGGRGADEQGAQVPGAVGQGPSGTDQGTGGNAPQYPAPEGWGNDGVWRDSAIDSNYETGVQRAVPSGAGPHEEPGYSYFSDGKGWANAPGANGGHAQAADAGAPGVTAANATAVGGTAVSATAVGGTAVGATTVGAYGPGGGPTAVYGGQGGYGAPVGPVPGGPGGYGAGPGGPFPPGPPGPGGPFGHGPGGPMRPGGPVGPRGPYGRRKGNWWRHWSWKKALAVTGGVFVFFMIAMYGTYQYMSSSAAIPAALASVNYQNTTVYYSDGKTVLGTFGATNRQDLTYQQIPQQLQNAVVAAEDKGFWTEGGISPTGILRAAMHDVTSGGGSLNGGSTITQEFVRGYYDGVGTQQTASRKIKEIFIAQKLASKYSKQWILTNYLNLIYLGENSYGVSAAAQTYFGVPASQLTVAQDAVIAGIIQQPSTFPLLSNRAALKARWSYVLQQMAKDNYITQAQMSTMKFPALLTDQTGSAASGTSIMANNSDPWAPYIMTQVENELIGPSGGVSQQQLETGGLKIVTTISRSMEVEMYKAVNENLNSQSISNTSGATLTSLPSWALVGAELQDPKTGEVIAEYPGKGQTADAAKCKAANCDVNTAAYAREQVGSSFKPYVLATAVNQGMNVQSSTLDTSPYICIAPDASSQYSMPMTASAYAADSHSNNCLLPGGAPVENDGGETIGKQVGQQSSGANKGASYWSSNVQNALALSSNTAFTDLAHKVGTANVATTAKAFGVNMNSYTSGGSGLPGYVNQVGMALGIAPLTVQEQTSMLATIADNGMYHQAHLVKYWQQGIDGSEQMPKVDEHAVLQPNLAADVQYAMEQTTINGTAAQTVTFGQQNVGTVIGKTGTTTDSKSGFFIGSTSQYSLVVGMFTTNPKAANNLAELGGGGFGGYWPAKIWNTFAQAEFSSTPQLFPTNPAFYGTAWNLLGSVPKAKPTVDCVVNGHKKKMNGTTCQAQNNNNGNNGNGNGNGPNPTGTVTCDPNIDHSCTVNPDGTVSCDPTNDPDCTVVSPTPSAGTSSTKGKRATATATATQAGLAVGGGGLTVLPGSLLWTTMSRRRRRKRRAVAAE